MSTVTRHTDERRPYRWVPDDAGGDDEFVEPEVEFEERVVTGEETADSHPHPHQDDDADIPYGSAFKERIQRDPEICSSCFRVNYDVIFPFVEKESGPDGTVRYFVPAGGTTKSLPQAGRETRNPPRACECGRIGPLRDRPLPKERAIEYAWYLSETLAEKGIEHDPLVLVEFVRDRKRTPEWASRDDTNYADAVKRAREVTIDTWIQPVYGVPALPPGDTDVEDPDDAADASDDTDGADETGASDVSTSSSLRWGARTHTEYRTE